MQINLAFDNLIDGEKGIQKTEKARMKRKIIYSSVPMNSGLAVERFVGIGRAYIQGKYFSFTDFLLVKHLMASKESRAAPEYSMEINSALQSWCFSPYF